MGRIHTEAHLVNRVGWLRAAVLGANDGIISTASLMVGVPSASSSSGQVLLAGTAGMAAGAMAMAAGEYVSVSSQSDTEKADLGREQRELLADLSSETEELAQIYVRRGVQPALARDVAVQLMAKDALGSHARDELGITDMSTARPVQAALTSAVTFSIGAAVPIAAALLAPAAVTALAVSGCALVFLAVLGALGARAGGAGYLVPTVRVAFWGATAMAVTAGVGSLMGHAV